MKANELRIGNYILHEPTIDDWEEIIVTLPSLLQVDISPESYCGIPLTEEWLLKCGLQMHHADFYCDQFMIRNLTGNEWVVKYYPDEVGSAKGIRGGIRLYYLHQLQNLYFALTGIELEIQL